MESNSFHNIQTDCLIVNYSYSVKIEVFDPFFLSE